MSGSPRRVLSPQAQKNWELRKKHEMHLHRKRNVKSCIDNTCPVSERIKIATHLRQMRQIEDEKWQQHASEVSARVAKARGPCKPSPPRGWTRGAGQPGGDPMTPRPGTPSVVYLTPRPDSARHGAAPSAPSPVPGDLSWGSAAHDGFFDDASERSAGWVGRLRPRRSACLCAAVAGALAVTHHSARAAQRGEQWRRTLLAALCLQRQACARLSADSTEARDLLERARRALEDVTAERDWLRDRSRSQQRELAALKDATDEAHEEATVLRGRAQEAERRSAELRGELGDTLQRRNAGTAASAVDPSGACTGGVALTLQGTPGGDGDGTYLATSDALAWSGPRGWRLLWQDSAAGVWCGTDKRWRVGDLSNLRPAACSLQDADCPLELRADGATVSTRWAGLRAGASTVVLGGKAGEQHPEEGLSGRVCVSVDFTDGGCGDRFVVSWALCDPTGAHIPVPAAAASPGSGGAWIDLDKVDPRAGYAVLVATLPDAELYAVAGLALIAALALEAQWEPYAGPDWVGGAFRMVHTSITAILGAIAVLHVAALEPEYYRENLPRHLRDGETMPLFGDRPIRARVLCDSSAAAISLIFLTSAGRLLRHLSPDDGDNARADGIRMSTDSADIVAQDISGDVAVVQIVLSARNGVPARVRISSRGGEEDGWNGAETAPVTALGFNEPVVAAALRRVGASRLCWMLEACCCAATGAAAAHSLHIRASAPGCDAVCAPSPAAAWRRRALAVLTPNDGRRSWTLRAVCAPLCREGLPARHAGDLLARPDTPPEGGATLRPGAAREAREAEDGAVRLRLGLDADVLIQPGGCEGQLRVTSVGPGVPGLPYLDGDYRQAPDLVFGQLVWRPSTRRGRWALLPPGGREALPSAKELPLAEAPAPHLATWAATGVCISARPAPTLTVGLQVSKATGGAAAASEGDGIADADADDDNPEGGKMDAAIVGRCTNLARKLALAERRLQRAAEAACPITAPPQAVGRAACSEEMLKRALATANATGQHAWSEDTWSTLSQPMPLSPTQLGGIARMLRRACTEAEGDLLDELAAGLRAPPERDCAETLADVLLGPKGLAVRGRTLGSRGSPLATLLLWLAGGGAADADRLLLWPNVPPPGGVTSDYARRLHQQGERRNRALMCALTAVAGACEDDGLEEAGADEGEEDEHRPIPQELRQWARTLGLLWALAEGGGPCHELARSKGQAWRVVLPGSAGAAALKVVAEHAQLAGLPFGERRVAGYAAPVVATTSERVARKRMAEAGMDAHGAMLIRFNGLDRAVSLRNIGPYPGDYSVLLPPFALFNVGAVTGGDGETPLEVHLTLREHLSALPEFGPFVRAQPVQALRASERLRAAAYAADALDRAQVPLTLPAAPPADAARMATRAADAAEADLGVAVDVARVAQHPASASWQVTLAVAAPQRMRLASWAADPMAVTRAVAEHSRLRPAVNEWAVAAPRALQAGGALAAVEEDGVLSVLDFRCQLAMCSMSVALRLLVRPERFDEGPLMQFLADTFPLPCSDGVWELLRAEPAVSDLMTDVVLHCVAPHGAAPAALRLLSSAEAAAEGAPGAGSWPYPVVEGRQLNMEPPLTSRWRVYDCPQDWHKGSSVLYGDPPGQGCNRGRLSSAGAWVPDPEDRGDGRPWYQLDAGVTRDVGGVVVMGRADCAHDGVGEFAVEVSRDGEHWSEQRPAQGERYFRGAEPGGICFAFFADPARCRYVRLLIRQGGLPDGGGVCALRAGLVVELRPGESRPLSDTQIARAAGIGQELREEGTLREDGTLLLGRGPPTERTARRAERQVDALELPLMAAAGELKRVRFRARGDTSAPLRCRRQLALAPQLLVHLGLERCGVSGEEVPLLGLLLRRCPMLQVLDLDWNERFDDTACRALAPALKHTAALEELRLAHCRVADSGTHALCGALSSCRALRCIRLCGNRGVSVESLEAICRLIKSTDLTHVEVGGTALCPADQEEVATLCKERRDAQHPLW